MTAKTQIGKTDVYTTGLGLGTNAVGGHNLFNNLNDDDGRNVVKTALDNGIQLLDTAFMYGLGHSEELIGEVIKDYKREDIVLASKAAHDLSSGQIVLNNRPDFLKQSVDESLKRLGTDYLDIFYIHFPDADTPKAEAVGALADLKAAGKIRAVGVSNFSPAQIKEANADGNVDVVEDDYSLVQRKAETASFPYLRANDISFVPYFPLASGLLTGKYSVDDVFAADDARLKKPNFNGARFQEIVRQVDTLKTIATDHDATVAQIVLAWYIKNPDIAVVIPGAKRADQVLSNAKALDITLSTAEYNFINGQFS